MEKEHKCMFISNERERNTYTRSHVTCSERGRNTDTGSRVVKGEWNTDIHSHVVKGEGTKIYIHI